MTQTYQISSMTCDHCAMRVREALQGVPGVESAQVDLQAGTATVASNAALDASVVARAVDEVGYKLEPVTA